MQSGRCERREPWHIIISASAALAVAATALGQELRVGSPAPGLSVDAWVHNKGDGRLISGRVNVVYLYRSENSPSVRALPILRKAKDTYGELNIVAVAAFDPPGAAEAGAASLAEKQADLPVAIGYDEDRSMWRQWAQAAGQNAPPVAFVINRDGTIAWIGSPHHPSFMQGCKSAFEGTEPAPALPIATPAAPPAAAPKQAGANDKDSDFEPIEGVALAVGDKAPALKLDRFVKGEPITGIEKGRVHVIEFWATWCNPCIAGMPHISELAKQYESKGVRVVGVNIWDDPANVEPFMKNGNGATGGKAGNELMQYTVAVESRPQDVKGNRGHMSQTWMEPAGQNGIPSAFIIDGDGRIAWIGHPATMDDPLKKIVAGEWDIREARAQFAQSMQAQKEEEARFAEQAKLQRELRQAFADMPFDRAWAKLQDLAKNDPEAARSVVMQRYGQLMEEEEFADAYRLAGKAIDHELGKEPFFLNLIAWMIVDPDATPAKQDLDLALRAAKLANELSENKDPAILDTLAKVHWDRGERDRAIRLQERACSFAKGTQFESELEGRLEMYRKNLNR